MANVYIIQNCCKYGKTVAYVFDNREAAIGFLHAKYEKYLAMSGPGKVVKNVYWRETGFLIRTISRDYEEWYMEECKLLSEIPEES